jgi:CHAT domain-containing protein
MGALSRNRLKHAAAVVIIAAVASTPWACQDSEPGPSSRSIEIVSEALVTDTSRGRNHTGSLISRITQGIDSLDRAGLGAEAFLRCRTILDSILAGKAPNPDLVVSLGHKLIHLEPDSAIVHRARSGEFVHAVRDPLIRARFFDERAQSWEVMSERGKAEVDYLRALASLETILEPDASAEEQLARVCHNYAFTLHHMGRSIDSEAIFLRSAGIRKRLATSPDRQLAQRAMIDYAGDLDFLPGWDRKMECLRIRQNQVPNDVRRMGWALHNACGHIFNTGQPIDSMPRLARWMTRHYEPSFKASGDLKQDYSRSFLYMAYYHAAKGQADSTGVFVGKGLGVWTKDSRFDLAAPTQVEFNDMFGGVYHTSLAAEVFYKLFKATKDTAHAGLALRLWRFQDEYIDSQIMRTDAAHETPIVWKLELNASIVRQLCALEAMFPDPDRASQIAARIDNQRKIRTNRDRIIQNTGLLGDLSEDLKELEARLNARKADEGTLSGSDEAFFGLMERVDSFRTAIAQIGARIPADFRTSAHEIAILRDSLPPGTGVIEYLKFDRFIARALITRTKLEVSALDTLPGGEARLRALADAMHTTLTSSATRDSLRAWLMPHRSALTGLEQLIIIPDQQLAKIPFECLTGTERTTDEATMTHPTIRYATDLACAVRSCYPTSHQNELSVLACAPVYEPLRNPSEYSGTLASLSRSLGDFTRECGPLEFSAAEVRAVSNMAIADVIDPSLDTEKEFLDRAKNAGVIHLAMHGFSSDRDPSLSGLVFDASSLSAGPERSGNDLLVDDGTLRAFEIAALDLQADLVVLSACQTAAGTYVNGEGSLSLSTAFMAAGARNVVSSLWKVDDLATKEIMVKFYEKLAEGMGKADALAEAKRWYRKEYPSEPPSKWAAFILIGDNEPVHLKKRRPMQPWLIGGGLAAVIAALAARRRRMRRAA